MKSYQILSVIGGVLGMIIIFLVYAVFSFANIMTKSFGGSGLNAEQVTTQIVVSIILYIIAIIIPFTVKKTKPVGIILLVLSFATLISAGYFGVIGMALLIAGGIAALKQKERASYEKGSKEENKGNDALEILKGRYAKGEISKEEFERMKHDLE